MLTSKRVLATIPCSWGDNSGDACCEARYTVLRPRTGKRLRHDDLCCDPGRLHCKHASVIGVLKPSYPAEEFISFLNAIDKAASVDLDVRLILCNYGTCKTEAVRPWFGGRPPY